MKEFEKAEMQVIRFDSSIATGGLPEIGNLDTLGPELRPTATSGI